MLDFIVNRECDAVPVFDDFDPGWAVHEITHAPLRDFKDVCDCANFRSLLIEEQFDIVNLNGDCHSIYRAVAKIPVDGDYAHNLGEKRFGAKPELTKSRLYRSNGFVEDTSAGVQGRWAVFPRCQKGDYVEACWITELKAHPDFQGHFWRTWPYEPLLRSSSAAAVEQRKYVLVAHKDLPVRLASPAIQIASPAGWQIFQSKQAQVSTFPSWASVADTLVTHCRSVYLDHMATIEELGRIHLGPSLSSIGGLQTYLSSFDQESFQGPYLKDPLQVLEEQSGTRFDLALLGCGMLASTGREVKVGLSSLQVERTSVAGPFLDRAYLLLENKTWFDPLTKADSLESDFFDHKPLIICDVFGPSK